MINNKFRPMAWCVAVAVAALACYMTSYWVAAERNRLAEVEREIVETRRDILSFGTELETRGRLSQIERWNEEVFALAAPTTQQFLEGGFDLAALYGIEEPAIDPRHEVRQVSATVAAAPRAQAVVRDPPEAPRTRTPVVRHAAYVAPVEAALPARVERVAFLDEGFSGEIAERAEREGASGE